MVRLLNRNTTQPVWQARKPPPATTGFGDTSKCDGWPVRVKATEGNDGSGVLRIDFPGGAGADKLEPIEWDELFTLFDDRKLAMIYQEETKDEKESRFVKFVSRDDK